VDLVDGGGLFGLRVAIVCSWLNQYGGAERVLEVVHEMYPEAPIYTSIYWPRALPESWRGWDVRPSPLDRCPFIHRHHQWFLPFYPYAFEHFDFSDYDLVLSITSAFAHGVVTRPGTLHVCYCLTPARFLWDYHSYVRRENIGRLLRLALPVPVHQLRLWDRAAADRVDEFLAISEAVRQRIGKHYRRPARVIYPPVEVNRFSVSREVAEHYLVVSRLVPYKRIDLAIEAFNRLELPLWIVGDGRDRPSLERMASSNIRFLGHVEDKEMGRLLATCRALVFPGEEDFGIAPLEAQAAGRPVVAYAAGGALETVKDGETGLLFHEQEPEALAHAVMRLQRLEIDPEVVREHAFRFDRALFERQLAEYLAEQWGSFLADRDRKGG
jgi:glycosyltransferase involved in cell wall biosynthesis